MRKTILTVLLLVSVLQADVLDFHTIDEATTAYEHGNYAKAAEAYAKVRDKNDEARYDYANALYKLKKYGEAAEIFKNIDDETLKPKALHNLGNSLANAGKIDEAITAYEAALKLHDDADTRYNLALLKQQKQQKQQDKHKKKQNKQHQNKKNDQHNRNNGSDQKKTRQNGGKPNEKNDQNNKNDNSDKQKKQTNQHGNTSKQQKRPRNGTQDSEAKQGEPTKKDTPEKAKRQARAAAAKAQPISDMEERKYNQMLNGRGIKTLMIPLSSKGKAHENKTTPW